MALANTVTSLIPKIIAARGLNVLRENSIMARLVRNESDMAAASKGDVMTFYKGSALTVKDVTIGATPPVPANTNDNPKYVTLNQWKKVDFGIDDKEIGEILDTTHFIPYQMEEAMLALANTIDSYILAKYTSIYNYSGTAGTTPFASNLNAYRDARAALNADNAKQENWRCVLNPWAEANAVVLEQFMAADRAAGAGPTIIKGAIGTKLGTDWYLDQNMPTHTAGNWTNNEAASLGGVVLAAATAGTSTFILRGVSTTNTVGGNLKVGDVFTIAGDLQPYRVKTDVSVAIGVSATLIVTCDPVLRVTIAASAAVTFGGGPIPADSVTNLLFHRDAFIFASRPMVGKSAYFGAPGHFATTIQDPISGISLRLEVIREYKQWLFDFDVLYGATLTEP